MKKTLFLYLIIVLSSLTLTARPVGLETAQAIVIKFMDTNDLQLVSTFKTDKNTAALYIFNTVDGFVIISADDCETPFVAYSREGRFDPNNVPVQMETYLQDFVSRIEYGIENQIVADEVTAKQWELAKTTGQLNEQKNTKSVAPLLTELWHQGCLYNSLCPTMQGPCDHTEVGCVAVAMGQIMHYWGYPAKGWGSHSYTNAGETLSADFGNTVYDWEHMPDSLTESSTEAEIEAVATLLYHCGVAVEMNYSPNGSGASTMNVPDALKRYFLFSRHLHRDRKSNDNVAWLNKLKACLDQQCPILYSGRGSGSHAFVCDGYDENDMLHFNWGWGGNGNGYFALGSLNPIGYNFNNENTAILDIFPNYEPCHVVATAYPASAGTIEGTGEYHYGENCTLTAMPFDNARFKFWKKDGVVVSTELSYSFKVVDDVDGIEACFTFFEIGQLSATVIPDASHPENPCVNLTWDYADTQWTLLKEFETIQHKGVTTDGENIYTYTSVQFGKYSMDGELLESFHIDGIRPSSLTFDGSTFYCSDGNQAFYLYHLDFEQKRIIDSTHFPKPFSFCAYDSEHDGFWIIDCYQPSQLWLVNRQGEILMGGPATSSQTAGYLTAKDGNGHLLTISYDGQIFDYDVINGVLSSHSHLNINNGKVTGIHIGKYDDKDAAYVTTYYPYDINDNFAIRIYEIKSQLEHIVGYRIYRADNVENTVMLADEFGGSSYIDFTWKNAPSGEYRFGISSVYANGIESEIVWSNAIEKTGFGIDEGTGNQGDEAKRNVQKVFENGQVFIIKDGKRYDVQGRQLDGR